MKIYISFFPPSNEYNSSASLLLQIIQLEFPILRAPILVYELQRTRGSSEAVETLA